MDAHRVRLCCARGIDVCFEDALADWNQFYSVRWREDRQRQYLAEQRAEIERHKWIESEKAGRDLGRDAVLRLDHEERRGMAQLVRSARRGRPLGWSVQSSYRFLTGEIHSTRISLPRFFVFSETLRHFFC